MEFNRVSNARQLPRSEDKCRLVSVRPAKSFLFEAHCCLVSSRSHHVAVYLREKCRDGFGTQRLAFRKVVMSLEPVDASILASDETVEACCHVNGYP